LGYDIVRFHHAYHAQARRNRLLDLYGVDLILDIGANIGQYGAQLRKEGYKGNIISFEPLADAYSELLMKVELDAEWSALNCALGSIDGTAEINVSKNSCSSSLLGMLPEHQTSAPDSVYVRKENIRIKMLDTVFDQYCSSFKKIFMKVYTQGYGMDVLKGSGNSLEKICGIQIEVSLVNLYANEALIEDFIVFLRNLGFVPMSIEPGFADFETGKLLQADLIFFRQ